jgi:molecular chaperone DnaK
MKPLYLGIDLGTTNSTAALFDGEGVTLVRNSESATLTPSVVRIDAKGRVTVGSKARRALESDPQNTRAEFKRLMGTAQAIEFPAAKLAKRPEELAAEVLRALRSDTKEQLGFLPERAVISVPALFELPQSAATAEAARLAGFTKVELIQEPVASALAAGWNAAQSNGSWLVYDLGGGTFDASLLETQDGLLRVVGHDGDNFLGGRDFDWAIVDWMLGELKREGVVELSRAEPRHAVIMRKLKHAAEEAKLELSRAAESSILVPSLDVDGAPIDVDLVLTRATLESLCAPLIDRSIAVCKRLLEAHGAKPLERVVLVGGPTVMPLLRERVRTALSAPIGEGLDPMTLVAQGAAIYAATSGLDARPATQTQAAEGRRLWLQFPAMSSDLTPHVVGRVVTGKEGGSGEVHTLRLLRGDELWQSEAVVVDGEQGFVLSVELLPKRPNTFRLEAKDKSGAPVPVQPATITIVQGLTISDPPLSRTIGVALANDRVCVYFERGAPLPAKRTFVHHTVESVARGSKECLLRIPIVQGELEQAHLCRLVGTLQIKGETLSASLPAGSAVEMALELDRGGRLTARALVPALDQVFEDVAHLLVPEATPDVLATNVGALRERLTRLGTDAFRRGSAKTVERLNNVEASLVEVERDIAAARGGDADAGQKARRTLIEVDALLEDVELDGKWPELEHDARDRLASASRWLAEFGTPEEQRIFQDTARAVEAARLGREPLELQRQLRVVSRLSTAAYYRNPQAWEWAFENCASECASASDLVRAQLLVRNGRAALERRDHAALRNIVEELWHLLPADAQSRRLGYDSGVR